MTPEEKARAYDEALAMAKECITYIPDDAVKKYMLSMFPELTESKDEEIRRVIYGLVCTRPDSFFENGFSKKEMLAWLEKQSKEGCVLKSSNKEDVSKLTERITKLAKNYDLNLPNRSYDIYAFAKDILAWIEKQGSQKSVNDTDENIVEAVKDTSILDMVEPKFHEGEWILLDKPCQIESMSKDGNYIVKYSDDDETSTRSKKFCETYFHLWTIQDAKNGDVLYSKKHNLLWIYKNAEQCHSCVNLNYSSNISIGADIVIPNDTCPATKEQRDTLLKAMDNAGYTFDFETKELKKIEEEIEIPFGAKDSELQEVTYFIPKGFHAEIDDDKVVIKKGEKPTAWSEEDEGMLNSLLHKLEVCSLVSNKELMWIKGKLNFPNLKTLGSQVKNN